MLHAEQLAFNAGMFRARVGALLTGMDWIMILGAIAGLKGGMPDTSRQAV
jgi:hypothetical protein